jgi:hypothetical protein
MITDQFPAVDIVLFEGVPTFTVELRPLARLARISGELVGLYQGHMPMVLRVIGGTVENNTVNVHYAGPGWTISDQIRRITPGLFHCQRTWRNESNRGQEVVLTCGLERLTDVSFYMIPAVSYNGNHWGGGLEPKGLLDASLLSSQKVTCLGKGRWVFGGDRSSLPACTITEGNGYVVGLYAAPEDASHAACSLEPVVDGMIHWLYWPLQEQPRTYIRRDAYAPGISHTLHLDAGSSCTRSFFIAIHRSSGFHHGYCTILDEAWAQFYHEVPARYPPQQLWALGIQFAKESLWVESDEFVGFSIGLTLQDGQWVQRPFWRYEIGWCGQGAGLAVALLQDYLWHGDEDSWRRGEAALDFWMNRGRFPNGLFYTNFDYALEGILNPPLDTCNLGWGAYHYLCAWEMAEKASRPRPEWLNMGLGVCNFFSRHAAPDGKLGRFWNAEGHLLDVDGTIGSFLIWPLIKAYRITHERSYLQAAEQAYRAYAEDDLARVQCTAGALDTDCIDKESAWPLLIAGLDLYEVTGNPYYLCQAELAAYYMASWQRHYTLTYPNDTPAAEMGYDTFGGTSVSVQHHHLDPWGALLALGWLRLAAITGKEIWRQRALATWHQSTMGLSDGSLTLKGITRPPGGQDEGFFHTRWGGEPGDVSDWLVAWPTALRLITLMHWPKWNDLEFKAG